jgi:hypothetical protein
VANAESEATTPESVLDDPVYGPLAMNVLQSVLETLISNGEIIAGRKSTSELMHEAANYILDRPGFFDEWMWQVGSQATISQFNLLKVKTGYLYPCRRSQDWLDCRVHSQERGEGVDVGELAGRANDLGGFMVPVNQVSPPGKRRRRNV